MKQAQSFKLSRFAISWYGILLVFGLALVIFFVLKALGGNDPVLLKLGGLQLRWYGIVITASIVAGTLVAQFLAERRGDNPDRIWALLVVVLICGLVVSRLWYVAFTWDNYKDSLFSFGDPRRPGVLELWRGGVALHGAILGGVLGALVFCRITRTNYWRFADYGTIGLALGIAIGRWGNFFNNEAYGRETHMFWGIKIPCDPANNFRTTGTTPGTVDLRCPPFNPGGPGPDALFHPTFLYESLWTYACFLVLFYIVMKPKSFERRFKVRPRNGDIFLLFLVLYSVGRFFIESLRTDSLFLDGNSDGIRVAQLVSILLILCAGFWLFYRHRVPTPDSEALSVRVSSAPVKAQQTVATKTAVEEPESATPEEPEDAVESAGEPEPEVTAEPVEESEMGEKNQG